MRWRLVPALTVLAMAVRPAIAADGPRPEPVREGKVEMRGDGFAIRFDRGATTSLTRISDVHDTDYIRAGSRFGDLFIRWRAPGGGWRDISTIDLAGASALREVTEGPRGPCRTEWGERTEPPAAGPNLVTRWALEDGALVWTISLRNEGAEPIEVGDLAFPCPMNSDYVWDRDVTYHRRVIRHSFVAGHGSFIYWMRCDATGPYLLLVPLAGTHLEYFDTSARTGGSPRRGYTVYVHSAGQEETLRQHGTRWRQARTGVTLAPAGREGDSVTYGFRLLWATDLDDVRRKLFEQGLFDVHVVPGMTLPTDLTARLAIRTRNRILSVDPEFPDRTEIRDLGERPGGWTLREIRFRKPGENLLTVRCEGGRTLPLEFFVTEPIETMVRKRGRFLARCQHRDPSKWYDGLITDWNLRDKVLLSPENLDLVPEGRRYMVTCDDPGLCKPAFLAAKNAEYPEPSEIEALEYYIERFVWGGLQRTEAETYAFGIHGIPDWKRNRDSADEGPRGKLHIWRIYDYPHVVMLYLHMYRIARQFPQIPMRVGAREYLRRAHGTAMAFFTIPLEVEKWSAYETGTYDEVVIDDLLRRLDEEGLRDEARALRAHWNTKVEYFIGGKANLFGSEYPFDTTGFESTHAFARYALRGEGRSWHGDEGPRVGRDQATAFLHAQTALNIGCRGWLETAYYLLGSDYRGSGNAHYTLSYMSQMGGWSILDYALYDAADPFPYLRLGYASILSSWALLNSGPTETNHGYWYPGAENDGGAGGGFEPAPYGTTWLGQPHHRGSWYYACEIDLGFGGALRAAATILADDPVFGTYAYGGSLERCEGGWRIWCRDGVRRRLHIIRPDRRVHLELEHDRIAADVPVTMDDGWARISFTLESPTTSAHSTHVEVSGLPAARYDLRVDGNVAAAFDAKDSEAIRVKIQVDAARTSIEIRRTVP